MAALRRCRRLAQVLLRIEVKLLLALGTAEVIRLPFVLGSSSGSTRFYVHAAHRVFHSYCAVHYDLSVVRKFCSNVDRPVLSNSPCAALKTPSGSQMVLTESFSPRTRQSLSKRDQINDVPQNDVPQRVASVYGSNDEVLPKDKLSPAHKKPLRHCAQRPF
jgi:hypothetical protein